MKKVDVVIDVLTGERTETERDETPEEKKLREDWAKQVKAELAEAEAKEAQRQAIADRLGLTAEELQVLLG